MSYNMFLSHVSCTCLFYTSLLSNVCLFWRIYVSFTRVDELQHICIYMYIYMYIHEYTCTYVDGLHSCAWHDSSTRVSWLIHVRGWRVTDIVSIWMSRSTSFPDRSFEWRGHREFPRKLVWNLGDSREKLFNMYGDSRENLLEILAVVIISSAISSVCSMNESRYIQVSVTYMNESWHTDDSSIRATCLIHIRDMTHPYVWHVSFTYVT